MRSIAAGHNPWAGPCCSSGVSSLSLYPHTSCLPGQLLDRGWASGPDAWFTHPTFYVIKLLTCPAHSCTFLPQLLDTALGSGPAAWNTLERVSYVWMKNRFVAYPFQNNISALGKEDQVRTWA